MTAGGVPGDAGGGAVGTIGGPYVLGASDGGLAANVSEFVSVSAIIFKVA